LLLIVQQSKSKHQAIWKYEALRASSASLVAYGDKKEDEADYVIPHSLELLQRKAIFITK
jgi:hypothetical protein